MGALALSDLVMRRSVEAGRIIASLTDLPNRRFSILTHAERQLTAIEAGLMGCAMV